MHSFSGQVVGGGVTLLLRRGTMMDEGELPIGYWISSE